MTDLSRAGKTLIVVFVIVFALGFTVKLLERSKEIYIYVQDPNTIPSIREIQQRLKDTGKERYDPGKIDGKISLTGKTQKAWNNYTCDQYAIRSIEGR